jgi:two-component system, OmpR family, response regulator
VVVERDGADVIVLVVDDEPLVLGLLATALPRFGLGVLAAGRGEAAVGLFEAHRGRIGAVLLDVQMEPWDGPRTLAELRRLDPTVPAAFMSGNTGRYSADELLALGAARVFPKPFKDLAAVASAIRELAAVPDSAGG